MLVVNIRGRLGNLMYCYALYRTLLERGLDVYMDISSCIYENKLAYELAKVFNITERLLNKKSVKFFVSRVLRKLHLGFKGYREISMNALVEKTVKSAIQAETL